MTSRDTSEYFIPSVPMPIPSVTVGNPKTCGIAPASLMAAITRSTRGWMAALQGFIVEWPFATPTIGFSKSSSLKPTARNIARLGERATPAVINWERLLSFVTAMSFPGCRRHCSAVIDGDRIEPLGEAICLLDLIPSQMSEVLEMDVTSTIWVRRSHQLRCLNTRLHCRKQARRVGNDRQSDP